MSLSARISSALSESASEIRTLTIAVSPSRTPGRPRAAEDVSGLPPRERQPEMSGGKPRRARLCEGPVEPGRQRLDIRSLDRRATPDAKTRRRIAVIGNVERRALFLQQRGHGLDEIALTTLIERHHFRIGDRHADRGVRAR